MTRLATRFLDLVWQIDDSVKFAKNILELTSDKKYSSA